MSGQMEPLYNIDGQVNIVMQKRQVGSSIKPFIYFTAFQSGIKPNDLIMDMETSFKTSNGGIYNPLNYSLKEHGIVSVREALASSLNIPSVKILDKIGIETVYDNLKIFGINLDQKSFHYGLSLVLGSPEISLFNIVYAYSVFANLGIKVEPQSILKITKDNEIIYISELQKKRIIDLSNNNQEAINNVNDILRDEKARSLSFGYNSILNLPQRVAVKTGTTRNFRDNWTIGYTDQLVVGVWVGNNDNSNMENITGITGSAPIWVDFIKEKIGSHEIDYGNFYHNKENSSKLITSYCLENFISPPTLLEITKYKKLFKDKIYECKNKKENNFSGIIYPQNNEIFYLDPLIPLELQTIIFKKNINNSWFLDNKKLENNNNYFWTPVVGLHILKLDNQLVHFEVIMVP